jgi:Uncharacterised protein family UPF0047
MKSYRKELWFNVPARRGFVNITPQVEDSLRESGIREGLVLVNAMHITASVFINDDEKGLQSDRPKQGRIGNGFGVDLRLSSAFSQKVCCFSLFLCKARESFQIIFRGFQ